MHNTFEDDQVVFDPLSMADGEIAKVAQDIIDLMDQAETEQALECMPPLDLTKEAYLGSD